MAAARLQSWPLLPLLIRVAIVTGLRRGALLGLRWCDVRLDADQPHLVIPRTKNGDTHVSPLTADLVSEFRRMQRVKATGDTLVFCRQAPAHSARLSPRLQPGLPARQAARRDLPHPAPHLMQPPGASRRRHSGHCRACRTPQPEHDAPLFAPVHQGPRLDGRQRVRMRGPAMSKPSARKAKASQRPLDFPACIQHLEPPVRRLVGRAIKALEESAVYRIEAMSSPGAVRAHLRLRFADLEHEEFHALWLDAQNRLISADLLFTGTLNANRGLSARSGQNRAYSQCRRRDPGA